MQCILTLHFFIITRNLFSNSCNLAVIIVWHGDCMDPGLCCCSKFIEMSLRDVERFKRQKVKDLKDVFTNYAILQIDRCKKVRMLCTRTVAPRIRSLYTRTVAALVLVIVFL